MATRATAIKTTSNASVSETNTDIENRIKALEEKSHTPCGSGSDSEKIAELEAKLAEVINVLKQAAPGASKNL